MELIRVARLLYYILPPGLHAGEHNQNDIEAFGLAVSKNLQSSLGCEKAKKLPLGVTKPEDRTAVWIDEISPIWTDPNRADRFYGWKRDFHDAILTGGDLYLLHLRIHGFCNFKIAWKSYFTESYNNSRLDHSSSRIEFEDRQRQTLGIVGITWNIKGFTGHSIL